MAKHIIHGGRVHLELNTKRRYMGGLDGLRAISVLAVIAYHMNLPWAGGGFLGVGVFFVLSGYLITDLLIEEWERSETINLKRFWIRRARRLLPAMITVVTIIYGYVFFFQPSLLHETQMDAVAALFYFSNWWSVFHHQSYFDSFMNPSLLKHFWSLAVEEQFYLIWPLLVLFVLRLFKSKKALYILTLVLAAGSLLCMGLLYHFGTDPSRVYYGTDSRAFSLLFGAILACIWPSRHLTGSKAQGIFLDGMGGLALLFLFLCIGYVDAFEPFLYSGGLGLFSIVVVVLISALAHPSTLLGKWIGARPLRWIGVRSYGMYLWHYPIIQLTTPANQANEVHPLRIVIQLILIILVSALSYRLIEQPIRRRNRASSGWLIVQQAGIGLFALFLIFSGTSVAARHALRFPVHSKQAAVVQHPQHKGTQADKQDEPGDAKGQTSHAKQKQQATKKKTKSNSEAQTQSPPSRSANSFTSGKVTAIGDSVMLGAEPYLKKSIPQLTIDCKVGRQFREGFTTLNQLKQSGALGRYVIIELGTNGPYDQEEMDELIRLIGPNRKIVLITIRVPRPWERVVNQMIQQTAAKHKNVTSVDWHQASAGQASYIGSDGVHLSITGARKYSALIVHALLQLV
ncbi:hypothetical protein SINU_07315 [Sporolactobacillus inulinus CASD]|uniref:Acyltransferase 3 domain-containing protein n=2 Tax=Sporolactobacillus inulinus TaxID=2078 RepID=A0A0U1QP86_9BACL|nr:hypothetical protein SINU_07315 [Sporolactobacillus inulinus CASD]